MNPQAPTQSINKNPPKGTPSWTAPLELALGLAETDVLPATVLLPPALDPELNATLLEPIVATLPTELDEAVVDRAEVIIGPPGMIEVMAPLDIAPLDMAAVDIGPPGLLESGVADGAEESMDVCGG